MKNGRYILAATMLAATFFCAPVAHAAGGFEARAHQPVYDSSSLELIGAGRYRTETRHSQLRLTVCLRKRFGSLTFTVRCATTTGSGGRVMGTVGVPGCVKGIWRTTVVGEALGRDGMWTDQASAVSRLFRC